MRDDLLSFSDDEIEKFYKQVSENVKMYRIQKNMSQLDLALAIDIKSVAFYSNCENNRYNKHFNLQHLYKISQVLQVPLCDFLKV